MSSNIKYVIDKNSQIDIYRWKLLLENSKFTSPFQTPEFFKSGTCIKGILPLAFAVKESKEEYLASCVVLIFKENGILSYFSRRAIIFGGPVVSDACSNEALEFLLKDILKTLRKIAIYCEIRNYINIGDLKSIYYNLNFNYSPYVNIEVNLENDDLSSLSKKFKYNRRREIKQTINAGINYSEVTDTQIIQRIYLILKDTYDKKIKLPLPSIEFFISLMKNGLLKVFGVFDGDKVIGGSFCLHYYNCALYTYYYCGLRNYKKNVFPTHLAVFAALQYCFDNKIKKLDFMGAGMKNEEYGVRSYKMEFAGALIETGRFIYKYNYLLYSIGKLYVKTRMKI